jgi:hypothetical protein
MDDEIEPPSPTLPTNTQTTQTKGTNSQIPAHTAGTVPASGRQAFRDIRRQLTDHDLASPGVQKLLLDELERSEAQCEILNGYVERFHIADKRAAVLEEKNRTVVALEVVFGVGVGVGCAIIGLSPLLWPQQPNGWIALAVGVLLVLGTSIARVVKK